MATPMSPPMRPASASGTPWRARVATAGQRAPWGAALLGLLVGGTVTLVAQAPARWLADGVAHLTQGQVQLRTPQGTLWSGSAQLALTGGPNSQDQAALPGRLAWTLRWREGALRLQLQSACCLPQGLEVALQPGWMRATLQVSDHTSRWPAPVLAGLGTPWNTVQPQGILQWETQGLRLQWQAGRWRMQGQTLLEAQQLSSRLSTLAPMGSYQLLLRGAADGSAPRLVLRTLEGVLQLQGEGELTGGRLRFRGEARAEEPHTTALSNLLNLLGRRNGSRSHISLG